MTVSHCSSVVSESVRLAQDAGVEDDDVEAAEPLQRGLVDRARDRAGIARIGAHEQRARARRDRARPASSSRPVKTTRAPSSVSRVTIASPMPDVPPVTRARWSACRCHRAQLKQAKWHSVRVPLGGGGRCRAPPSALAARERQLVGQAEAREHLRRHEAGHPGDAVARAARARRARRACSARRSSLEDVAADRELAVGARRPRAATARPAPGRAGTRRSRRARRTSSGSAASTRSHPRSAWRRPRHVAALHRVHVGAHDRLQLALAERAQRRLLALLGQLLVDAPCARAAARCSPRRPSCRATRPPRAPRSRAPRA